MSEGRTVLALDLPYPPSLNRYYRSFGGRVVISREGRRYTESVVSVLSSCGMTEIRKKVRMRIDVYPPDARRRDIDNILKCLLDSLVKGGALEDDSLIRGLSIEMREPMPDIGGMVHLEFEKHEGK